MLALILAVMVTLKLTSKTSLRLSTIMYTQRFILCGMNAVAPKPSTDSDSWSKNASSACIHKQATKRGTCQSWIFLVLKHWRFLGKPSLEIVDVVFKVQSIINVAVFWFIEYTEALHWALSNEDYWASVPSKLRSSVLRVQEMPNVSFRHFWVVCLRNCARAK